MDEFDDGADLVGALGQGVHFAGRALGLDGQALQVLGDLGGGLPAGLGDMSRLDGLDLLVAQEAGHLAEAALGAGQGVAELGHALHHGQQVVTVTLLFRLGVAQGINFAAQCVEFVLQCLLAGCGGLEVGLELLVLFAVDPHGRDPLFSY
jgi:hypothetical protein